MARYSFEGGWEVGKARRKGHGALLFGLVVLTASAWFSYEAYQRLERRGVWQKPLPDDLAAMVNDHPIPRDLLESTARGLADASGDASVTPEHRRQALNQLVGELLLVDGALSLGLAHSDDVARRRLVSEMAGMLVNQSRRTEVDPGDLRSFYDRHLGRFSTPEKVELHEMFFSSSAASGAPEARRRAETALRSLRAGDPFGAVDSRLGNRISNPISGLMSADALADVRSPAYSKGALELEAGAVGGPFETGEGYWVAQVVKREPSSPLPFEEVIDRVRQAFKEEDNSRIVDRHLHELRNRAEIRINTNVVPSEDQGS